jgi:D-alanyl-D-alanine dipeptidase
MKRSYTWLFMMLLGVFSMTSHASQKNIVLIADPKVLAIHIVDNHEEMVDLKNLNDIAYGPSPEIPNNTDYTKLRKSVYEKLKQAQALLPKGLHFCLYEGYRSLSLQKKLFDERYQREKKEHPTWSHEKIFTETTKLVSPVINLDGSKNIPPHSTGGAIDVYLLDDNGKAVDMGIHPKDWINDDGANALTASTIISDQAKKNRKIMSDALSAVGFVNYPTEYWHWSYGDRYWAYHKKAPNAIYK